MIHRKTAGMVLAVAGLVWLVSAGCGKKYPVGPVGPAATATPTASPSPVPETPTPTPPPDCQAVHQTIQLPGILGDPGFVILSTATPTATPTSVPWQTSGIIRSDADWASYCAMVSLDPAANPSPVDFSTRMILFWGHYGNNCPISESIESVCLFNDRWEVTILKMGDPCNPCPAVYLPDVYTFTGYVVDQSSLPLVWKLDDQTTNCFGLW